MPNVTAICYVSSLLFYGMGFFKMLVLKNAVIEHVNVSLATSYYFLAIFFAVIGSLFLDVKILESKKFIKIVDI